MQENITNQLRRRLNLYRSLFLFLLLVCLSLTLYIIDLKSEGRFLKQLTAKKVICPHEKEVRRIISKLQYNGLYRLLQPDVYISLDFRNNAWILHNVHHFNPDGTIKLSEGRYGLCGELAQYTYEQIKPLFEDEYAINFAFANEASFFPPPTSTHIVLRITPKDPASERIYILDPSFQRFGPEEEFEDYIFNEHVSVLYKDYMDKTSESFAAGASVPLIIKKNYLLGLSAESSNGLFDKDNFVVGLSVTRRNAYANRLLYALRKNNGELEVYEDRELAEEIMSEKEFEQFKKLINSFFNQLINKYR